MKQDFVTQKMSHDEGERDDAARAVGQLGPAALAPHICSESCWLLSGRLLIGEVVTLPQHLDADVRQSLELSWSSRLVRATS